MPQQVTYQIKVTMTGGNQYYTNPLTTLAGDGMAIPSLFDGLVEHVVADWAKEKAAGRLFDIRSVEKTSGITLLNPDQVEAIEVMILGVAPADPAVIDDVRDEVDYEKRLVERFPDDVQYPDTQLPPTDAVEGSSSVNSGTPPSSDPSDEPSQ